MKKTTRLLTIILAVMILATSISTTKAEAASKIKLSNEVLYFHTDLKETITQRLTLNGADASKVTWKVKNAYRCDSKGKEYKVKASKVAKVSKKGNVRAIGYGFADVVATYKGKTYTCNISVNDYNKQPIAGWEVTSTSKKADKAFVEAMRNILSYDNKNDQIMAIYRYCQKFKNVTDYPNMDLNDVDLYKLGALVDGWSYCEHTAEITIIFCDWIHVPAKVIGSGNHAWTKVKIDGVWYQFDADGGAVAHLATDDEVNHLHDDAPYLYNEYGNGREYLYGKVIKDGAHLKEYFQEMKANNVTTFKFRGWYNYKNRDASMSKELYATMCEIIGAPYAYDTYDKVGLGAIIKVEDCKALPWETNSFVVTITNWDALNLD